jgi:hypothetical protein
VAIVMLLLLVLPIMSSSTSRTKNWRRRGNEDAAMKTQRVFSKVMLGLGFLFLYVPIVCLVVFSVQRLTLGDRVEFGDLTVTPLVPAALAR